MKSFKSLIAAALCAMSLSSCGYNDMVAKQESVEAQWAQVENVYQRRMDLIPNLVATVKGYASHESGTLTAVTEARSKATSITIDPTNLTEESLTKFQQAQDELSGVLSRLMAVREAYPDLKANQNFLDLQSQLEGTENRIATERKKFNDTARDYNTFIRSFPNNIISSIFGFEAKPYFKADEASATPPKVEF